MANIPPRPLGANFFGVFLHPSSWGTWDFDADWKAQIDACKSVGANFVVFWGSVFDAQADLPLYLSRRRQLVEYIGSQGMYCLAYASYNPNDWGGITISQAITIWEADAALLSKYPHVVGYVPIDEPFLSAWSDATVVTNCGNAYAAIRAVVPADFPVCAAPIGRAGNVFDYTGSAKSELDSVAAYCDFFAYHPFATVSAAQLDDVRAAYPGKKIMLPSTVAIDYPNAAIATVLASCMDIVGTNDVRGMGYWLAYDFNANTWGMFTVSGGVFSERASTTAAFRDNLPTFPARQHRRYPGKPRLSHLQSWGSK